jgi:hemerythrin superfamily protein
MANPIDIAVSVAKRIERSMEARRDGLVGVFQTIAGQHGEVASLIDRVKADARKREALWPRIRVSLLAHEKAELKIVYPVLGRYSELDQHVAQHAQEAQQLEDIITRLDAMSVQGEDWMTLFESLAELVVTHANEEENEIFPAAINVIGHDRSKDMDDKFRASFKDFKAAFEKVAH